MSTNWVKDINEMHKKFGVHDWMKNELENNEWSRLQKFLNFRMKMVQEEVDETNEAIEHKDPEEIVDGLIDMCVFAIGTLDAFGIDANKAWDQIYNANMMKEVGVKEGRPNPLGLPDLVKPDNWENPSHEGNHGSLHNAL
tara:strand:+ start:19058 stop:19477 length:420 start_codon:yes stop_codon:yes gene_type:complete